MNYLYSKIERELEDAPFARNTPLREAFWQHLQKVIRALKGIEWVDSGDDAEGAENNAIEACLGSKAELAQAIEEIHLIKVQREAALELADEEITALKTALKDLLEDTQHAGHDCGDTPENCPVLNGRETLARFGGTA